MEHVEQKNASWEKQDDSISRILASGMQTYVDGLHDLRLAFGDSRKILCCMDEGTPYGIFRSAGSGMLMEGNARNIFIDSLKEAGIEGVTSHAHCGAAGIYKNKHRLESDVDDVAKDQAVRIAEEIGVPFVVHITELKRPEEFHCARVCYYDGTGHFNPSLVDGLPAGFVVSRRHMNAGQALDEVRIAVKIALGDHGFGERFSKDSPFLLIAIGGKEGSGFTKNELKNELSAIVAENNGGQVKADGFDL